jgi:hypothetical protein
MGHLAFGFILAKCHKHVLLKVPTVVTVKIIAAWDVTPCSLVGRQKRLGGISCLQLQDEKLHNVTSQLTVIFTVTAVSTLDPADLAQQSNERMVLQASFLTKFLLLFRRNIGRRQGARIIERFRPVGVLTGSDSY